MPVPARWGVVTVFCTRAAGSAQLLLSGVIGIPQQHAGILLVGLANCTDIEIHTRDKIRARFVPGVSLGADAVTADLGICEAELVQTRLKRS